MNTFKKVLFILGQCTWGILQTLLGAIICLKHWNCPHKFYRGAIDTQWAGRGGMSLGLFIFTPQEQSERADRVRVHEYGHCFQSLMLGPLYLILVGLPSIIWANLPYFRKLRQEKGVRYVALYCESWASKLGELVTGEAASWH